MAVVRPETVSSLDIASYIDVNLPRLERFVERQIAYRESLGELLPDQVAPEDVVAEAIATALGDELEKPERIKIEPWLYRLASEAIDRISASDGDGIDVPLERHHGTQNVQASDEARLQFHQPDDRLLEEDIIADGHAGNPEQMAARSELITLVQLALRDARRVPTARSSFFMRSRALARKRLPPSPTTRWRRCTRPSARPASTCNAPCPSRTFSKTSTWSIPRAPEGAAFRRSLRTMKQELTQENRNDHER